MKLSQIFKPENTRLQYYLLVGVLFFMTVFTYFGQSIEIPKTGDENFYLRCSESILKFSKELVQFNFHNMQTIWYNEILERGWFIPTTSLILLPAQIFTNDIIHLRIYIFGVNFIVLAVLLKYLIQCFNFRIAVIFAVLHFISPIANVFAFSFWGESLAGKFVLLLILVLYKSLKNNTDLSIRRSFLFGGLLTIIIFLRPSFIFVAPVTILLLFLMKVAKKQQALVQILKTDFKHYAIIAGVVISVLSLWSVPLSQKYGGFFLTTTTSDLSPVFTFCDDVFKDKVMKNRKETRMTYQFLHRHYLMQCDGDLTKYAGFLKKDKKLILSQLSWSRYQEVVQYNFKRMFFDENWYLERFKTHKKTISKSKDSDGYYNVMMGVSTLSWYFFLGLFIISLFFFLKGKHHLIFVISAAQLFTVGMLAHPFIALAIPRHSVGLYHIFIFIASLGVGLIIEKEIIPKFNGNFKIWKYLQMLILAIFFLVCCLFI